MSLKPITFDGEIRPASADGAIFFGALGGRNCSLDGCAITNAGNIITITAGHLLIGGRVIEVEGDTSYTVSPTVTTGVGRLILNIDLADVPVFTLSEEYQSSESGLITLTKESINISGTVYQAEICRFTVASSTISEFTYKIPTMYANKYMTAKFACTLAGTTSTTNIYRDGNWAQLYLNFSASSTFSTFVTGETVGEVPTGFRPSASVSVAGFARTGSTATSNYYPVGVTINTAGAINVTANQANIRTCNLVRFNVVYRCASSYWINNQ